VVLRDETLSAAFARSVRKFSRRTALYFFGKTLSYQECGALVERFACGLAALGIGKGDRVALCLPNCPQAVIAYFGILRAGGIVVACNPTYTQHELSAQLRDAGVRAVVVLDLMYDKVQPLDLDAVIVTRITDFMTTIARYLYRQRSRKPPVRIEDGEKVRWFAALLEREAAFTTRDLPAVSPDDLALLQYTGGTTGVSKGAMLCHRNLTANVQQLLSWFSPSEGEERFLAALPLFHVFGMTVTQNICLMVGGTMVLVPDPRDMSMLLTLIRKKEPTVLALVPALIRKLLEHCGTGDFSSARFCISGGSALPYGLLKQFKERTGHLLVEGYGLSEASPVTHCNLPQGLSVKRSVGLPIPNTESRLVDETGQDVPAGGVGELWVRGPQVMLGYWNNPEETANALRPGGWLATGDMARMDEDGFFYIVDRKKDMILSASGFNVYPSEIERVLARHPDVHEAAVIGVTKSEGTEAIKAFIVSPNPTLSAEDLLAHCRRFLAPYKVPKVFEFRTELPCTIHGKVLYRMLRKEEEARGHLRRAKVS
jgi:long-chain acyl-CoA synthetase